MIIARTLLKEYDQLIKLAVSFGQALQMTNILKDVWDDQKRGVCWFPRDVFNEFGYEINNLSEDHRAKGYISGIHKLVKITHSHQINALRYIQLVPVHQPGIRRHCIWALGMAVLTLKRIYENPTFSSGSEVKISRIDCQINHFRCRNCAEIKSSIERSLFSTFEWLSVLC